ncbi:MAG: hypothetical protein VW270_09770 [Candidatus Poseidoniales archaeon]
MVKVYGNMDWFSVAEQPDSIYTLPLEFQSAFELWEANSGESNQEIVDLLTKYVGARFVGENIPDWQELFEEDSYGEFESYKKSIAGFDFSENPIPLCKAEAWFEIQLKDGKSKSDLEKHLEEQGAELNDCLAFFWIFEDNEDLEDLDLTFGDHKGSESIFVEEDEL